MARYRDVRDDDRYSQNEQARREAPWGHDESTSGRRRILENQRRDYDRSRFGERAEYDYDEPRYNESNDRFREDGVRSSLYRNEPFERTSRRYGPSAERSRLRCRDIMTRDLMVATRDTTIREVSSMMREEDTGVIPIVDYDMSSANGKGNGDERHYNPQNFSRGKVVGLITDRDIVVRAVAEGKDCSTTLAEETMSTDIHTAKPDDRVVDVIRKMGSKQVRRIPVVNEGGYLKGMISMADIARETEQDRELAEALEEISQGATFWNKLFN